MTARRAVISLANSRGNYHRALNRLEQSLVDNYGGDMFMFRDESEVGAPPHEWLPYAFKVFAFRKVREMGYDQIVWLDSSVVAVRNVQPVFDHMDKFGYIMQEAGQLVGRWCNPETELAMKVNILEKDEVMYGNAGFLGLDFRNPTAVQFFDTWYGHRHLFQGSWDNHRHDMTVGSIIANRLGMTYQSGNEWLDYAPPEQKPKNDTIIFHAQGL